MPFFKLPLEKFEEIVLNAPKGIAQLIVSRAKLKIANQSLDSLAKIKILKEKFNVEFD
jgi:hypothetical protein